MKPTVTWAVVANGSQAVIAENTGPGKGFAAVKGRRYHAPAPVENADQPGTMQFSNGPGKSSVEQTDPKRLAETQFAHTLGNKLVEDLNMQRFDRLILVAAPHMLGELRTALPDQVRNVVMAEVDKDLTRIGVDGLAERLGHVIAA